MRNRIPARYHRIDGWRGYSIPGAAVAGASDTGMWEDSPCPTDKVIAEIRRFRRECLRPAGIKARSRMGGSSNVFCGKRWVCVSPEDWPRAKALADEWLRDNEDQLRFMHNAD